MRRTLYQPSRAKSGMATVLGMLIFIGVIFTCVIPLFLYVNEVNSIYDRAVVDMRQFDQEREMERLEVYAFPVGEFLDKLYVHVRNKCALDVRVVRVWVNDAFYDQEDLPSYLPLLLSGVSEGTVKDIPISQGYFDIWVTTDRGNVFASLTNTIHITESGWEQGAYNFGIQIYAQGGQCTVTVYDDPQQPDFQTAVTIKPAPVAYRIIQVPKPGTYYIDVDITGWTTEVREVTWENPIALTPIYIPQE